MQVLLKAVADALVGMFAVGVVVSAFVIAISFVEDMRELFSKDD